MSTPLLVFTLFHTVISLIALLLGVPAIRALYGHRVRAVWTEQFLIFAVLTTVTGFFFPYNGFTPAIGVGIISMVIFAAMYVAHRRKLAGYWRWVYAGGMVASEFFLAFVTIAQSFQKISFIHQFAPTGSEPAFAITQGTLLAVFVVIGFFALKKFKPAQAKGKGTKAKSRR